MMHASLFSGIGGFDLAAEWMGWKNIFHCEWNEFGQKILKYYWPNAISYGDITKTDFTKHRGTIDILTGGFPCQPYSIAGKRKGKEDDRHLWPEMFRAIQEIQPTFIVGENVPGLINWSRGLVFEEVQANLEASGYKVIPFILPACGVNAPHKRERIWFVAHSINGGHRNQRRENRETDSIQRECGEALCAGMPDRTDSGTSSDSRLQRPEISEQQTAGIEQCDERVTTNTESEGRERTDRIRKSIRFKQGTWDNWPTVEPTICSRNDGLSSRLAGITFPKHRNESIKGYGNAIVPQVVVEIFRAIEQFNNYK